MSIIQNKIDALHYFFADEFEIDSIFSTIAICLTNICSSERTTLSVQGEYSFEISKNDFGGSFIVSNLKMNDIYYDWRSANLYTVSGQSVVASNTSKIPFDVKKAFVMEFLFTDKVIKRLMEK